MLKMEIEAKIKVTVTQNKDETQDELALAVEQFLNQGQGFNLERTGSAVGVRVHVQDWKQE